MQFSELLGKKLKSEEVVDLLEAFDVDVIYDFDRLYEGSEDTYWASFYSQGFLFHFDEKQILDVIFLYIIEKDGFTPINQFDIDVPIYNSFIEAKENFEALDIEYTNSINNPNSKLDRQWIKSKHDSFTVHYEFAAKTLQMITISIIKKV